MRTDWNPPEIFSKDTEIWKKLINKVVKRTNEIQENKWRYLYLNNNFYILRADEGGKTVLWNKDEYRKEAQRQLEDTDIYRELNEDKKNKKIN